MQLQHQHVLQITSDSVLVHGPALRCLRTPGLLGHDDLVHAQHCAHRLRGQLQRPPLGQVQVKEAILRQVPAQWHMMHNERMGGLVCLRQLAAMQ